VARGETEITCGLLRDRSHARSLQPGGRQPLGVDLTNAQQSARDYHLMILYHFRTGSANIKSVSSTYYKDDASLLCTSWFQFSVSHRRRNIHQADWQVLSTMDAHADRTSVLQRLYHPRQRPSPCLPCPLQGCSCRLPSLPGPVSPCYLELDTGLYQEECYPRFGWNTARLSAANPPRVCVPGSWT
jgi:hypothetical protein